MNSAYYFEELQVGQVWTSARRTVTESDIVIFAGMTGDYDRAHVDHDYASKSRFKQPLMHGMMGLAWVAGLSTTAPAVQTLALVSVDQWNFLRPVHIGDTVYAVTEVVELAKGGRSAGKVTWRKSLLNQHDEVVQTGLFLSLVELRPKLGRGRVPAPHQTSLAARPIPSGSVATTPAPSPAMAAPGPVGSESPVGSVSSETVDHGPVSSGSDSNGQAVVESLGDHLRELPTSNAAPSTDHPSASVEA
jgi:acyl dehydratase